VAHGLLHVAKVGTEPRLDRGVRPIVTTKLAGLTVHNMKTAHTLLESHRTIGKIVIGT
jgi:hypothetical protein